MIWYREIVNYNTCNIYNSFKSELNKHIQEEIQEFLMFFLEGGNLGVILNVSLNILGKREVMSKSSVKQPLHTRQLRLTKTISLVHDRPSSSRVDFISESCKSDTGDIKVRKKVTPLDTEVWHSVRWTFIVTIKAECRLRQACTDVGWRWFSIDEEHRSECDWASASRLYWANGGWLHETHLFQGAP